MKFGGTDMDPIKKLSHTKIWLDVPVRLLNKICDPLSENQPFLLIPQILLYYFSLSNN